MLWGGGRCGSSGKKTLLEEGSGPQKCAEEHRLSQAQARREMTRAL